MFTKLRSISLPIQADLREKMVFVGGPRQVGKTTLAKSMLSPQHIATHYFNWDLEAHRKQILKAELPFGQDLLVFDEIHKYSRWRNLMKGFFDIYREKTQFLVTGSARLDHFRKGGDSLVGRYHYYRLHPFSLCEMNKNPSRADGEALLNLGGFPEPLFSQRQSFLKRWQKERIARVVTTDLQSLESVRDIHLLELLVDALPDRVGSPLSIRSLSEDLAIAQQTCARWLTILDSLYMTFRISPFGAPKIRAVKKEQKLYFWDWTQNLELAQRFENMVASQLLKYCHIQEDTLGEKMDLRFIRDIDGREIDFVVLKNKKPLFAVECKTGERSLSSRMAYFRARTAIPKFYQVHLGTKDFGDAERSARLLPWHRFCIETEMP